MSTLILILLSAVFPSVSSSTVCLPTWSVSNGVPSDIGEFLSAKVLQNCLTACERRPSCVVADFDLRYPTQPSCWLYNSTGQLTQSNAGNGSVTSNRKRYRIQRNCDDLPDEEGGSLIDWVSLVGVSSFNGQQAPYWTEYDCFTYCRYRSDCLAVDFDSGAEPPCFFHTNPDDLSSNNTFQNPNAVQYLLNRTTTSTTTKKAVSCVGQWFPNTTWCQPGEIIQIRDASFKSNSLCPLRTADDAHPPDASWFPSFSIQFLDPTYYSPIQACNGSTECYVRANCPFSTEYDDEQCKVLEVNSVAISYSCFFNGSTTQKPIKTTPYRTVEASNSASLSSTNKNIIIVDPAGSTTTKTIRMTSYRPMAEASSDSTVASALTQALSSRASGNVSQWLSSRMTQALSTTQSGNLSQWLSTGITAVSANVGTEWQKNNKDIIIGVVIGLGVPLLLITIIVIICAVIKQRRNRKEVINLNDGNYYYDQSTVKYANSTVQRGIVPDNEINEISISVDTV